MPAVTVPKNAVALGAGYLYFANLGTSLPANTVAGSVFTDNWPAGWNEVGITTSGSEFDYALNTDTVDAAEYYDPVQYVTTSRQASLKMELEQISATNFKFALNGGSLTVSGSGATQLNAFTPAAPGSEVRIMVGWESQDNTERLVFEQAFQIGSLAVVRNKGGANRATLGLEWRAELSASGFPFRYWTAGTVRA